MNAYDWLVCSRFRVPRGLHLVFGLIASLLLFVSPAHAAYQMNADQGEAYAKCQADLAIMTGSPRYRANPSNVFCAAGASTYTCRIVWTVFPNGSSEGGSQIYSCHIAHGDANDATGVYGFPQAATCSTRPPVTGLYQDEDPLTDDRYCDNGCEISPIFDTSTSTTSWQPTGDTCTASPDTPPTIPDADGDGTPDPDDAFPNDPAEDTDTDGDGVGDNNDFAPEDDTNGDDDGQGNESDNSASGGGTCAAPPACTGDGIACATLFQQWQTRCAVERLGSQLGGGTDGPGEGDGEEEGTDYGDGSGYPGPGGPEDVNIDGSLLDTSGFLGSASCPTWGPLEILGESYPLPQVHCDILEWIGYLVVMVALVVAARILGS